MDYGIGFLLIIMFSGSTLYAGRDMASKHRCYKAIRDKSHSLGEVAFTSNATIIGGGRLAYMMSKDGCFWEKASKLNPEYQTPNQALWILSLIAILMVLFIPYGLIFQLISLVMVFGGIITACSYYSLKYEKIVRGQATFSPIDWVLPPIFISFSLGVITIKCNEILVQPNSSLAPLVGLLIVIATYLILKVKAMMSH